MLNKYKEYLEPEVLNEAMIKPDPPGVRKIYDLKSYSGEFSQIYNDFLNKAKKEAATSMAEKLKKEFKSKIISFQDENGRQKIIMVEDVIVENRANDYFPVLFEDKDRKFRYKWENPEQSNIFDIGRFLDFFEENYIGKLIQFMGKSGKGGGKDMKFMKEVVKIGIHTGQAQDYLIVECDDKTTQLLYHNEPIKLIDPKMKILDPYGEENWDN